MNEDDIEHLRKSMQSVIESWKDTAYNQEARAETAEARIATAREAMGIDWMNLHELSEAIPPVFTEWIGRRLLEQLEEVA